MAPARNRGFNVGVVGATGIVGRTFIDLIEKRKFPIKELRLFASEASVGKTIKFAGKSLEVLSLDRENLSGLDVVFFSAGSDVSLSWAPLIKDLGATVIDNSSAFRMHPDVVLCVPEVNGHLLDKDNRRPQIIANPNCSTIQMVLVLEPLRKEFGLESVICSTYQSVSGAGAEGIEELRSARGSEGREQINPAGVFPHSILENCIPQIGSFDANGFSVEENKLRLETRKILALPQLPITATAVRVPVTFCHAEAVWVRFPEKVNEGHLRTVIAKAPGVVLIDDLNRSQYPLQGEFAGRDEVGVGRLRVDPDDPQRWLMWIVGDNVRKGAALNGIQIAERLFDINHQA